jgi:hypothetical protein
MREPPGTKGLRRRMASCRSPAAAFMHSATVTAHPSAHATQIKTTISTANRSSSCSRSYYTPYRTGLEAA